MPRPRTSNTRDRILATALELFATRGLQQTSLQHIADRLGVTKPALYYHFSSRDELVTSLLQPLADDVEALLERVEQADPPPAPRVLLGEYFDVTYRHRAVTEMAIRELSTLTHLDLGVRIGQWRYRLMLVLTGPEPDLAAQTRAIVALGGLADCTVMFQQASVEELRAAALDAACAALVISPG